MHIGERIKEVMTQQRVSVISVAREIECERTNIYNIYARKDINTKLLEQFCVILNHDFFKELSKDLSLKKNK
jgi:hypothetical protein